MNITLYNFTKSRNSTKQPGSGSTISATLKENTSNINPVFTVNTNPNSYNYMSAFGRYYYIDEIVYTANNLWEIHGSIDSLATWKSEILNTTAFVLFSQSSYNIEIPDVRLSTKDNASISTNSASMWDDVTTYVLYYVSSAGNTICFESKSSFDTMVNSISSSDFFSSIVENVGDYIAQQFNSVTDCIKSAISLPVRITHGAVKQPILGKDYSIDVTGNAVPDLTSKSVSIAIPWQFSDFRNRSQYTSLLLYLPGYGILELNPDDYIGQSSISIQASLSNLSGDLIYKIGNTGICKCNIATPIQIGIISSNLGGAVSAGANSAMAGATGNPFGMVTEGFNAVTSLMSRNVGSIGSNGGFSSFEINPNITLTSISHDTNVEPSSVASTMGRPLNSVHSLGGMSGYVQCAGAQVIGSMPGNIKEEINAILNGGVYIE